MSTNNDTRASFADEAVVIGVLRKTQNDLDDAIQRTRDAKQDLTDTVIGIRPLGLLTVAEMAAALGKRREFIDTLISESNKIATPVMVPPQYIAPTTTPDQREAARHRLSSAMALHVKAKSDEKTAREARDRAIAMAYQSKVLRPSVIGQIVRIDRNHVGRVARKAGVPPLYRANPRNQFTAGK